MYKTTIQQTKNKKTHTNNATTLTTKQSIQTIKKDTTKK